MSNDIIFKSATELAKQIKNKKIRYKAYQERSLKTLKGFKKNLDLCFVKDQLLV